jgi:UDP-N-acetylglucosamine 2-epimerase (non-hydrolysing)
VVVSTHPHTRQRMQAYGIGADNEQIRFLAPFCFFEFITLERKAKCLISDSGTVQEECALFGVPNVTIRDVTERPETIECGSNILSGAATEDTLRCVELVLGQKGKWTPPPEYLVETVSDTVLRICLGYHHN